MWLKVSLTSDENIVFRDELSMDLMFQDGKAVLHVVDAAKHFSAITFLDAHSANYGQAVQNILLAFVMI